MLLERASGARARASSLTNANEHNFFPIGCGGYAEIASACALAARLLLLVGACVRPQKSVTAAATAAAARATSDAHLCSRVAAFRARILPQRHACRASPCHRAALSLPPTLNALAFCRFVVCFFFCASRRIFVYTRARALAAFTLQVKRQICVNDFRRKNAFTRELRFCGRRSARIYSQATSVSKQQQRRQRAQNRRNRRKIRAINRRLNINEKWRRRRQLQGSISQDDGKSG